MAQWERENIICMRLKKNLGVTRMMMKAALVFYSHLPNLQYLINILFYYFIKNNK